MGCGLITPGDLMDLNDFGTHCSTNNARQNQDGIYEVCGATARQLPPGAYGCTLNQYGEVQIHHRDLQVDDLIDFADSLPGRILDEIETFWSLGEVFERHGYLHRRGYLLYGPQGSGKS